MRGRVHEGRLVRVVQGVHGSAAAATKQALRRHVVPALKDRNEVVHVGFVLEIVLVMKVL